MQTKKKSVSVAKTTTTIKIIDWVTLENFVFGMECFGLLMPVYNISPSLFIMKEQPQYNIYIVFINMINVINEL